MSNAADPSRNPVADYVESVLADEVLNPAAEDVSFFRAGRATPRLRLVSTRRSAAWGAAQAQPEAPELAGVSVLFALIPGEFRCGVMLPNRLVASTSTTAAIQSSYDGSDAGSVIRHTDDAVLVDRIFTGGVFAEEWFEQAVFSQVKREVVRVKVAHIVRTIWRSAVDALVESGAVRIGHSAFAVYLPDGADIDLLKRSLPVIVEGLSRGSGGSTFCVVQSNLSQPELERYVKNLFGEVCSVQPLSETAPPPQ